MRGEDQTKNACNCHSLCWELLKIISRDKEVISRAFVFLSLLSRGEFRHGGMEAWGGNGIGYAASGSDRGAPWSSNL